MSVKIKNIMIVEDELIVSRNLEERLNESGFNVIASANSGEEAIQLCEKYSPDCILMDIKLSGKLDGVQTASIINETKSIPIIYLTAFADDDIIHKAKVTEPFGFLLKPFDVRDLKKTIEIALYKNELELKLKQSEEKFRILFNHSPFGNVLFDEKGDIADANAVFTKLTGLDRSPISESNIWSILKGIDSWRKTQNDLDGKSIETHLVKSDGQKTWLKVSFSGILLKQLSLKYFLGVVEDITVKKQSEEVLRESEFKLRKMVENLPAGAVYLDEKSFYFNKEVEAITGYKISEIINLENWFSKLYPAHTKLIYTYYQKDRKDGFKSPRVVEITRKDGEKRSVEFVAHLFSSGEVWILNDITTKVRAEEDLLRSRDSLKKLSEHLQSAREEERAHIAREVHDDLGQSLTALKMDLVWLQKNKDARSSQVSEKLEGMLEVVNHTIKTVQRLGTELRPKLLDDLGLISAIEWQTREFQKRSGINCNIVLPAEDINLDNKTSLSVFRVFQEALTNIARHSQATKVDINIEVNQKNIILTITDNGVGIPANKLNNSSSIGIIGMKERADIFGGRVQFMSKNGKGTIVSVTIPVEAIK